MITKGYGDRQTIITRGYGTVGMAISIGADMGIQSLTPKQMFALFTPKLMSSSLTPERMIFST